MNSEEFDGEVHMNVNSSHEEEARMNEMNEEEISLIGLPQSFSPTKVVSSARTSTRPFLEETAFVASTSGAKSSTSSLPAVSKISNTATATSRRLRPRRHPRQKSTILTVLPLVYTKENFQHFCRCRVPKTILKVVHDLSEKYLLKTIDQVVSKVRRTRGKKITTEFLLEVLRDQQIITEDEPLEVLVRNFFPLEYRRLLLPCASAGNQVEP